MLLAVIMWAILGLAAGWVASLIMNTNESQGMLADIMLGVLGAVVGGFLIQLMGGQGVSGLNLYSLAVAVLGAVLLIGARRALTT
ncbi:MAG TPA: GlsB/YeaQ/YmgE family stress response membrane protein [Patescibacteria group bacterium]